MPVYGEQELIDMFDRMAASGASAGSMFKRTKRPEAICGFTQTYALRIHEDLEMTHRVGEAKFLEKPARTQRRLIGGVIKGEFQKSRNLMMALIAGATVLKKLAQELTPVDTSALKHSAYVASGVGHETIAAAAFARSESIRLAQLARRKTTKKTSTT